MLLIRRGTEESTLSSPQRTRSSTSLCPLQMQSHTTHFNDQLNEVSEPDNYLHKKNSPWVSFLLRFVKLQIKKGIKSG